MEGKGGSLSTGRIVQVSWGFSQEIRELSLGEVLDYAHTEAVS